MRLLAVAVVAALMLSSVAPAFADTIAFLFEDASYTPSPSDQDITLEVYLTNDVAPATYTSRC